MIVGRFAPSPSGRIHLGNILCCLLAWLSARQKGGKIVLRMEDLDTARCPRHYARQMIEDLQWLGLSWDQGPLTGGPDMSYFQSQRTDFYQAALEKLEALNLVYPCFCTRAELHAASAPHPEDGLTIYAGTCRNLTFEERAERAKRRAPALRLRVPAQTWSFIDGHMGPCSQRLDRDCGDFLLRRSDGIFAYQLAVVVDDAAMGITEVVRGADLLSSTPRQLFLYHLLELTPPKFYHLPLLLAPAFQTKCRCWPGQSPSTRHSGGVARKAGSAFRLSSLGQSCIRARAPVRIFLGESSKKPHPFAGRAV